MTHFESINPADGKVIETYRQWREHEIESALARAARTRETWAARPVEERCQLLYALADHLEQQRDQLALLSCREMGKLAGEARSEIEKCAWVCRYYADNAPAFLADEAIESDAARSLVVYEPLGTVLAVMPWNFPFWQAMRCAAPAVAAGNSVVLKHASNVMGCALALERLFREAGAEAGLFQALLIDSTQVAEVVADERIRAISLTGSEGAGRAVAATAGRYLKRLVLELGGSDPFLVLADADVAAAAEAAAASRFLNCGQSCISAKRFLVAAPLAEEFTERFVDLARARRPGDPQDPETTLAPMAREDLRDELQGQVTRALAAGARLRCGGEPMDRPGWYYPATVLDRVPEDSPAAREEVFGPVAAVMAVANDEEAIALANRSRYGLGSSVWSSDLERAERVARRLEAGNAFVNSIVKSDPRLPFGGVKHSGYGRELSAIGLRELTSVKTLSIG